MNRRALCLCVVFILALVVLIIFGTFPKDNPVAVYGDSACAEPSVREPSVSFDCEEASRTELLPKYEEEVEEVLEVSVEPRPSEEATSWTRILDNARVHFEQNLSLKMIDPARSARGLFDVLAAIDLDRKGDYVENPPGQQVKISAADILPGEVLIMFRGRSYRFQASDYPGYSDILDLAERNEEKVQNSVGTSVSPKDLWDPMPTELQAALLQQCERTRQLLSSNG